MSDTSPNTASMPPMFEAGVLDADSASFSMKRHSGVIVYVRLLVGTLPSYTADVLVRFESYLGNTLIGRPGQDGFKPTRARLTMPAGRSYLVTVLATLPALNNMRPHLAAGLEPAPDMDAAAVPVALEGLPIRYGTHFRPTAGTLVSLGEPGDGHGAEWEELLARSHHSSWFDLYARVASLRDLDGSNGDARTVDRILEALGDESEEVRLTAAYSIRTVATRLAIAPFLSAIRDKRYINVAACLAAAYVFAAHPTEVPVEALLDLYHHMGRGLHRGDIQAIVVRSMGRLGPRASTEVVELLSDILQEPHAIYDFRLRVMAARALGDLQERAPVEVLLTGMENSQPELAAEAARVLARHPANIPEEVRAHARLMSDVDTVKRMRYEKQSPQQGE